jgi:hypothetical protein
MKSLFIFLLISMNHCYGQQSNCIVKVKELQGAYEGDCKDGKASGKGNAIGEDMYKGNFRNGYPDGTGKYTWKNGNWYEGAFKNGIREGMGTMHFIALTNKDSVITGYWKSGTFAGALYENAYKVISKSFLVSSATIQQLKTTTTPFQIEIYLTSVSGGAPSIYNLQNGGSGELPKPEVTDISVTKGSFLTQTAVTGGNKSNYYYLKNVDYPFGATLFIGQEEVTIELNNAANYKLDISIKQ